MFEIKVRKSFAAAHQLRDYQGGCERVHGHNWVVHLYLRGASLDACGVLVDFLQVRSAMDSVLARLDHTHLNEVSPFDELNPSAENLARYIFERCREALADLCENPELIYKVEVFETEDCSAAYFTDND